MIPRYPECDSAQTIRIGGEQVQCEDCGHIFIERQYEEAA